MKQLKVYQLVMTHDQGGDLYDDGSTQNMLYEFGPVKTYIQETCLISIVELLGIYRTPGFVT